MHAPRVTVNDAIASTAHMCGVNKYLPARYASIALCQACCCMVLLTLSGK